MSDKSNTARDLTAAATTKAEPPANSNDIVVIKKYANRRLYNTVSSSYVTLDSLSEMVKQNIDFVVFDARTGEDITRSVLTQIIVEEENKGQNLLPVGFPAPPHFLLRQFNAVAGAELPRINHEFLHQQPRTDAKILYRSLRRTVLLRPITADDPPKYGHDRTGNEGFLTLPTRSQQLRPPSPEQRHGTPPHDHDHDHDTTPARPEMKSQLDSRPDSRRPLPPRATTAKPRSSPK